MSKLELTHPTSYMQTELQKAIDLVAFGLQAADSLQTDTLDIPEINNHLQPASNKIMKVDDARTVFKTWILGNGLRDIIDAIGPSLEWARKICFLWTRQGEVSVNNDGSLHFAGTISAEEWNDLLIKQGAIFDYSPLRKKLDFLHQEYNLEIPEVSELIISFSYARNCLTHRRGIVGLEDIRENPEKKFVVRWKKSQIIADGESGRRLLELPAKAYAGEKISLVFSDASKEFNLGELIQFTAEEFVQIATTCFLFSLQIQESILALQQSKIKPK